MEDDLARVIEPASKAGMTSGAFFGYHIAVNFGLASSMIQVPVIMAVTGLLGAIIAASVFITGALMYVSIKKVVMMKRIKPNFDRFEKAMVERDKILIDIALRSNGSVVNKERNAIKRLSLEMKKYAKRIEDTIELEGGMGALPLNSREKHVFSDYLNKAKEAATTTLKVR